MWNSLKVHNLPSRFVLKWWSSFHIQKQRSHFIHLILSDVFYFSLFIKAYNMLDQVEVQKIKVFFCFLKDRLKCIWCAFIHPFVLFKGELPFSKSEWVSQNKIHPSKRVTALSLEGDSPFKKGKSPSKRANHPSEWWIVEKGESIFIREISPSRVIDIVEKAELKRINKKNVKLLLLGSPII